MYKIKDYRIKGCRCGGTFVRCTNCSNSCNWFTKEYYMDGTSAGYETLSLGGGIFGYNYGNQRLSANERKSIMDSGFCVAMDNNGRLKTMYTATAESRGYTVLFQGETVGVCNEFATYWND